MGKALLTEPGVTDYGELKGDFAEKTTGKTGLLRWMSTASRTLLSLRNSTKLLSIPVDERALTLEHKVAEIIRETD